MSKGLDIGVFGGRGIPSTYGGFETFLTELLPLLADRGHAVTCYNRSTSRTEYRGVALRRAPALGDRPAGTLIHSLTAGVRASARRHDVLLTCNVASLPGLAIATAAGIPTVVMTDGLEWQRSKWSGAGKLVFRLCAWGTAKSGSMLVADCRAMRDVYRELHGAESVVIPFFAGDAAYSQSIGGSIREACRLPDRFLVCGGRHVPENNLAEIVRIHLASDYDLPILVLGSLSDESPVSRELQELASDSRVQLRGHVTDRATFFGTLREAAGYLHGHSVGGMNPALLEAMAAGAAITALDTPFNREVLGPEGHYFTLDSASYRDTIESLLRAGADRRGEAQARARSVFGESHVVDAFEKALIAHAESGTQWIPTRWSEGDPKE